jgi:hypothetical protein
LISLIAALIAIGEPIHQAFVSPEISFESGADTSAPLAAPFTVRNKSWLFTMDSAQMYCGIYKLVGGSWGIQGITLVSGAASIAPGREGSFRCRLGTSQGNIIRFPTDEISEARLTLTMRYRILWIFPRASEAADFTWYTRASPPRWIRGVIAD